MLFSFSSSKEASPDVLPLVSPCKSPRGFSFAPSPSSASTANPVFVYPPAAPGRSAKSKGMALSYENTTQADEPISF